MQAALQLRRPENWQDFETLCKKLWGEIWECPEIKKNGRAGQEQHGVDVYGIPKGETQSYGIQCKGKDEYTHKQFSEKEIDDEIVKAKNFKPPLKKLYFATTAVKDSRIEEYIRKKDLENRTEGLFEVHIFSWEDIVELIDENKQTHDWYIKSHNFKVNRKVKVTFENNSEELIMVVPFLKTVLQYKRKPINPLEGIFGNLFSETFQRQLREISAIKSTQNPLINPGYNESWCRFKICFENIGNSIIEKLKAFLVFEGEFESVHTCSKGTILSPHHLYDTQINDMDRSGVIKPFPAYDPLVQKDSYCSDTICLKPLLGKSSEVIINWQLISKDYNDQGKLVLKIKSDLRVKEETIFIENFAEERVEEKIEDLITYN